MRLLTRHPVSVLGAWLVTLSAFVFLFVFLLDLLGFHSNPYVGLLFFLVTPSIFVFGLLLIPLGIALERRRKARGLEPRRMPRLDLNDPLHQRTVAIVLALTFVNVLIVSLAAYRGIEYMDSPEFCGRVCHTVMEPEYVAHLDGPHAKVTCVECHIGSGATSFVYYKLNGMRQLAHVVTGHFPRPVPSPVFNLRPATETCGACHSPEKFHGDKIAVVPQYSDDEKNTPAPTKLVLHVGGGQPQLGLGSGIHWHTSPRIEIDYIATDEKRETIPYVRLKDAQGKITEFRAADLPAGQTPPGDTRRMDCVDCHNRPTHEFFATPERAVDFAMATGAISPEIPFARKQAVEVLKASYPDRPTAERQIAERLRAFYGSNQVKLEPAHRDKLDQLVRTTQFLHQRSVFPAMNVSFGTHPSNLGHTDAQGCFRCHDDQHKAPDGRVIKQDCDLCHDMQ